MKRVVVIGGAGAMGQVIVRDLLDCPDLEVVIADYDRTKAEEMADNLLAALGDKAHLSTALDNEAKPRVRADFTDITNLAVMAKQLKGAACVINSTPYYHNVNVMEAALQAGCHYLDLGGLFHVSKEQLKLDAKFKAAGLTAVIGMGAAPGMTNLMAFAGQSEMEAIDSVEIFVGSVDNVKIDHPFLVPYSIETLIDEYTKEPMVFENGEFKAVPALSGALEVDFPAPVGTQEAIYTLHSEVLTIPMSFAAKGIKKTTFRLGLPIDFHKKLEFLMQLGFGSATKIDTREGEFTPRKILAAMIGQFPVPQYDPDDCEVVRVDVRGKKKASAKTSPGLEVTVRMETTVLADKRWKVSCGALDTGVPPSIAAQLILNGEVCGPGVLAPELAFSPEKFFAELAKRKIVITSNELVHVAV